eukprot:530730_1
MATPTIDSCARKNQKKTDWKQISQPSQRNQMCGTTITAQAVAQAKAQSAPFIFAQMQNHTQLQTINGKLSNINKYDIELFHHNQATCSYTGAELVRLQRKTRDSLYKEFNNNNDGYVCSYDVGPLSRHVVEIVEISDANCKLYDSQNNVMIKKKWSNIIDVNSVTTLPVDQNSRIRICRGKMVVYLNATEKRMIDGIIEYLIEFAEIFSKQLSIQQKENFKMKWSHSCLISMVFHDIFKDESGYPLAIYYM